MCAYFLFVSLLCAGIEARGFIFGPPIALAIGAKFVPLRKPKKLPGNFHLAIVISCISSYEYIDSPFLYFQKIPPFLCMLETSFSFHTCLVIGMLLDSMHGSFSETFIMLLSHYLLVCSDSGTFRLVFCNF